MSIRIWPLIAFACLLAACGPEVAGMAAATAKLEATQAEQAKKAEEQLKKDLAAAMKSTEAAASAAAAQ
jgi:hypothetical protein